MKKFFYTSLFLISGLSHAMDKKELGGGSDALNRKSRWQKILTIFVPGRQRDRASLENTQSPSSPISPGSVSTSSQQGKDSALKKRSAMKGSRNSSGGSPSGIEMSPRVYIDDTQNEIRTFEIDKGNVLNPYPPKQRRVVLQEEPLVDGLSTMALSVSVGEVSDSTQPSYYVDGDIDPCEDGLKPYRQIKEDLPLATIVEEQPINTALLDDDEFN